MQAYSYRNGDYNYESEKTEIVLLKVYEDENGNYYLDSGAIRSLKGLSKWHDYKDEFGGKETISNEVLLKKGASDKSTYLGSRDPSFSNEYKYDSILGLYQVTYADIMELIYLYEKSHPGIKVRMEIEYINKKEITNRLAEKLLKEYSEMSKNEKESEMTKEFLNDIKKYETDLLNNEKSLDKEHINNTTINNENKEEQLLSQIEQMLEEKKNHPDDNYDKDTNYTK